MPVHIAISNPDEITQSPTANYGEWTLGFNAYFSDDAYASCSIDDYYERYYTYNFDSVLPVGAIIDKVEVGIEFYSEASMHGIRVKVSIDFGGSWSIWSNLYYTGTEYLVWIDVTDFRTWTREALLNNALMIDMKKYSYFAFGSTTVYLDWIPVRVTYSIPSFSIASLFIGLLFFGGIIFCVMILAMRKK